MVVNNQNSAIAAAAFTAFVACIPAFCSFYLCDGLPHFSHPPLINIVAASQYNVCMVTVTPTQLVPHRADLHTNCRGVKKYTAKALRDALLPGITVGTCNAVDD